jgi:hypothetical protein
MDATNNPNPTQPLLQPHTALHFPFTAAPRTEVHSKAAPSVLALRESRTPECELGPAAATVRVK